LKSWAIPPARTPNRFIFCVSRSRLIVSEYISNIAFNATKFVMTQDRCLFSRDIRSFALWWDFHSFFVEKTIHSICSRSRT
jgi:hypothetical protein